MTMSKTIFSERTTIDFPIKSLPLGAEHNNIEQFDPCVVRLIFEDRKRPVDIGCYVYAVRKRKSKRNSTVLVDINSIKQERVKPISLWLESALTALLTGKYREVSLYAILYNSIFFLDWCEANGHGNVLKNFNEAKSSLLAFIQHLEYRIKINDLTVISAAKLQNDIAHSLGWMLSVHHRDLTKGIRTISYNMASTNTTSPPAAQSVVQVLSLCESLFHELSNFVLNQRKYPYSLTLPEENVWIFPVSKWTSTKEKLKNRNSWTRGCWTWSYESGKINSANDIYQRYRSKSESEAKYYAKKVVSEGQQIIAEANSNTRHKARLNLATWAHDAFVVLFLANTGMNYSQLRNMLWNGEFNISKQFQNFKAIKYRAKGKEVEFHISPTFLKSFKKYLKLRYYLLEKRQSPYLFIKFHVHSTQPPEKIAANLTTAFTCKVRYSLYSDFPMISSRQWRAHKADFLIKCSDISTTAMILQNSEAMVVKSYIEGSESESATEFTKFYKKLSEKVYSHKKSKHFSSAVGHCQQFDMPSPDIKEPDITPDCRQPEGCLFCSHYLIHADEIDIRKLYSLLYIVQETAHLAASQEHHCHTFGEVIRRIKSLLKVISDKSKTLKNLVTFVENDVFENENLDPYWEHKLAMLCEIGAL
jgi:integrase